MTILSRTSANGTSLDSINTRLDNIELSIQKGQTTLHTIEQSALRDQSERQAYLGRIAELEKENKNMGTSRLGIPIEEVVQISDPCIEITNRDQLGKPQNGKYNGHSIRFERIQRDTSDNLGRIAKLYSMIGNVALVQK